jgi:hypothetical protein
VIDLETTLDLTVDDAVMLQKLGINPEWILLLACDDKRYIIHPDDLHKAQAGGLVKRTLGRGV